MVKKRWVWIMCGGGQSLPYHAEEISKVQNKNGKRVGIVGTCIKEANGSNNSNYI